MADEETLLAIVAVAAVAGLILGAFAVTTNQTFGHMAGGDHMGPGGMGTTTPSAAGGVEWGVLVASIVLFAGSAILLLRARKRGREATAPPTTAFSLSSDNRTGTPAPLPSPPPATEGAPRPASELSLLRLLSEDERRMYLEIREHGGQMLQRDLVALGLFSKAKVTRLLDKLEAKGLVVREPHGMTNRIRLVAPKGP